MKGTVIFILCLMCVTSGVIAGFISFGANEYTGNILPGIINIKCNMKIEIFCIE